jgi:8-oxo-dGTP diphosphatase
MADFHVVAAAVVARDGRFLMTRRRPRAHLGGLWEFPGGGVDDGESPTAALIRELREELGVEAAVGEPVTFSWHEDPRRRILLLFYRALVDREPIGAEGQELGWFSPAEMLELAVPPADVALIRLLNRTGDVPPG